MFVSLGVGSWASRIFCSPMGPLHLNASSYVRARYFNSTSVMVSEVPSHSIALSWRLGGNMSACHFCEPTMSLLGQVGNRIEILCKKTCFAAPHFFLELITWAISGIIALWPECQPVGRCRCKRTGTRPNKGNMT